MYALITVPLTRTLHIYLLSRDAVTLVHSIPLHTYGAWAVSVVDNVIIAHNIEGRVSMLFDIKHSTQFPVGPPLPLAPFFAADDASAAAAAGAEAVSPSRATQLCKCTL